MFTFLRYLVAVLALAFLGACGGGGGSTRPPPPSSLPPSPVTSPELLPGRAQTVTLPPLNPVDPAYTRSADFDLHYGLDSVRAEAAYRRGYFGRDAVIAIADDGMHVSHPDLAGKIVGRRDIAFSTEEVSEDDGIAHGTIVALIAAGRRDNIAAGNVFTVPFDSGGSITTGNVHGVAPEASIVALQLRGGGQPDQAAAEAVRQGADIVNFSISLPALYYGRYTPRPGVAWHTAAVPFFRPFVEDFFAANFGRVAAAASSADTVFVWAAGNGGWNSNGRVGLCGKETFEDLFNNVPGCPRGELSLTTSEVLQGFELHGILNLARLAEPVNLGQAYRDLGYEPDPNDPGGWKLAPLFHSSLLGKWLVVGAVDESDQIASFSNGCGVAKSWCLVAPGVSIDIGPGNTIHGTSFAAPHVSGALAVLKSRMPALSMEIVQAILLMSAEPLGTRVTTGRPDDVYGWGKVDLESAIMMQDELTLVLPVGTELPSMAPALPETRAVLPAHFASLKTRMRDVKSAVGGIGGAYFNMPLTHMVDTESAPRRLGYAAGDMLIERRQRADTGLLFAARDPASGKFLHAGTHLDLRGFGAGRWRLRHDFCADCARSIWDEQGAGPALDLDPLARISAPFFATGEDAVILQMQGSGPRPFAVVGGANDAPFRQLGLRWRRYGEHFGFVAETSAIAEPRSALGANFGSLAGVRAKTSALRLAARGSFGGWDVFANYAGMRSAVSVAGGHGLLQGMSGLHTREWSAGSSLRDILTAGDELRLLYHSTPEVSGSLHFRTAFAEGAFADAFYNGAPQVIVQRDTRVNLSGRAADVLSLAYARHTPFGGRVALALEHDSSTGASAVSTHLRLQF